MQITKPLERHEGEQTRTEFEFIFYYTQGGATVLFVNDNMTNKLRLASCKVHLNALWDVYKNLRITFERINRKVSAYLELPNLVPPQIGV